MRYRLLVLTAVLASVMSYGQDFSNKGKDFWVGYGFHARMNSVANSQNMVLYFTSDVNANVKVEIPLLGYSATYKVTANTVTESSPLPKSGAQDARLTTEGVSNAGIHITADAPVVAYAHIYDGSVSGASLLFPTNTLGQDYYTLGYTQVSNEAKSNAFAFVIATEDNTTVEITPAANTVSHPANVPFLVSLSKGQIYNVMGVLTGDDGTTFKGVDLTGSRIRSVSSGANTCKKIAVFAGSGKINMACDPNGNNSADNLIQQMFPSSAWGRKYLTVPTRFMVYNYYRVMVKDPTTQVKLNGVPLVNLQNGRYYEFPSTTANVIEADKPVQVAQYMTTSYNCGNTVLGTNGDPEMICLSPVEQTISDITLNSTSKYAIKYHYINVVIPTVKVSSFKLDGVSQASQFYAHPTAAGYSWAQLSVTSGSHHIKADTGFTAIAYGMGSYESYGYNAGANVVDLYQKVQANNISTGYALPVTCRNEQFNFSVTVPYQPTQITWDFYNDPKLKDPQSVFDGNPVADSVYTKDDRTLYRYSMKTTLSYNGTGVLPVRVFLNNPTADGCSGIQQIDYEMTIVEKPKADMTMSFADCQKTQGSFKDASTGYDRTLTSWSWNFSDGFTTAAKQFSKTLTAPGTYTAQLKVKNDIGCSDDTVVTIKTGELPKASFDVNSSVCSDQKIELKNTSTGTILQHIWITDNTKADTLNSTASYFVQFTSGTHTVKLITIADGGCKDSVEKTITVSARPKAAFSAPTSCIGNGSIQFADSSSVAAGAITKYVWNFGDANASPVDNVSSSKNPSHQYTQQGTYSVQLIVISDKGCTDTATQTVSPNAVPKANFETLNANCGGLVQIKNMSTGSVAKYVWIADNGKADTLTTTATYQINFAAAGDHTIKLITIANGGCTDSTEKKITLNAFPKAKFQAPTSCAGGGSIQFTDSSTGTIAKYEWNFGDENATSGDNSSSLKNPSHHYTKPGNYSVQLIITSDKGCTDTAIQTISTNAVPKANFETLNANCGGLVQVKNTSTGSVAKYVWIADNGKADTLTSAAAYQINLAAGDHTIKLITIANGGCSDSTEKKITVNAFPKADFNAPSSCAGGGSIQFTDSSMGTIAKYAWNFGDANATSGDNFSSLKNPTHSYAKTGSYSVQLIITSDKGCTDTVVKSVSVSAGLPKANFEILNAGKLCAGTEIQLKNNSSIEFGSIVKTEIIWDEANHVTETDLSTANGKIYTHHYPVFNAPASQQQTIKLRAYSGDACVAESVVDIQLYAKPKLQFDSIPSFCNDGSVKQLSASEIAGNSGSFVFSGTGVNATGLFDSKAAGVGSHSILYTYTTVNGCSDSLQRTVQVSAAPKAIWNYTSACGDQPVAFKDQSTSSATIVSRAWTFSDGTTMQTTDQSFTKQLNVASGLSASLTITDNNGCKSEVNTQQIQVQAIPVVNFSLPTSLCLPNATANFKDLSSVADHTENSFTYVWNFGDAGSVSNSSVMKNPSHDYSTKGAKTVTLTVTSSNGCSASATHTIADIYSQPHAAFSVNKDQLCVKEQLTVADSSSNINGSIAQYTWNFGNGNNSSSSRPNTVFNTEGKYTVSYHFTDAKGCVSDTAERTIRVNGLPSVDAGADQMIPEGASVKLTPFVSGKIVKHIWSGMYLNTDSALTVISTPLKDQTYRLTVTGEGGCVASDDVTVKLMLKIRIPNVFSPNGDGIHDQWIIDNLTNYKECTVEVFDRYGVPVFGSKGYDKPWDGTYKGQPLPYGTYYYIIDTKSGNSKFTGYITILR